MRFEILSNIADVEVIASSREIRDLRRLQRRYGKGRWRKTKGAATIRLANGRVRRAELHWYEAHGIGQKEFQAKTVSVVGAAMARNGQKFAICIDNRDYPASLELRKIYRVIPDPEAEQDGDLRVVDESGEDYLYPADYFVVVDFPPLALRALRKSFAREAQEAR